MSERNCVVAVDVGNSAVKLCVRRGEEKKVGDALGDKSVAAELAQLSVPICENAWHLRATRWVRDQVRCEHSHWLIASVHQPAAQTLQHAIDAMSVDSDMQMTVASVSRRDVPMNVRVDQPDRLGVDRLLSAYGARNQFGSPVTVVDAGSAVTIDWVNDEGDFCGGAILPGLRMQANALAYGTDALPEIDWKVGGSQSENPATVAGTNTVDAIRLGLITAVTAAIDRLSVAYANSGAGSKAQSKLVLTGGDAATISPFVQQPHEVVPNLVCRGLLDLPRS
ncbi:type III pantothenate kinase [Stieleria marina]|uniref:Type III pantothenate kinase n=1 Tax=Stieleria marina TaxID=1930275 RepID=A0A517P2B1_9BACT|nr:Type III pantothenate kinase [Planctomycetes bacterium K23_9]